MNDNTKESPLENNINIDTEDDVFVVITQLNKAVEVLKEKRVRKALIETLNKGLAQIASWAIRNKYAHIGIEENKKNEEKLNDLLGQVGDFNSKHFIWGAPAVDARAILTDDFIAQNDLILVNGSDFCPQ
ncbi:hypothetical protein X975_19234, partial [Stegodyphus mimosarum]